MLLKIKRKKGRGEEKAVGKDEEKKKKRIMTKRKNKKKIINTKERREDKRKMDKKHDKSRWDYKPSARRTKEGTGVTRY